MSKGSLKTGQNKHREDHPSTWCTCWKEGHDGEKFKPDKFPTAEPGSGELEEENTAVSLREVLHTV